MTDHVDNPFQLLLDEEFRRSPIRREELVRLAMVQEQFNLTLVDYLIGMAEGRAVDTQSLRTLHKTSMEIHKLVVKLANPSDEGEQNG